jgi:glycosyltransferase involved in cell wall biosynthesis
MQKALIVNPYWDTLGGGERYTATMAKFLLDHGWQVDILSTTDLSDQLKNRFGIDIGAAVWKNQPYAPLSTLNYQLLFWLSDGSIPVSLANKTLIHLQFPFQNIGGQSIINQLKSHSYQFVVNSYFTKSFIDREYGVNSRVLYPPVDVESFKSGNKIQQILYLGRFSNLTQKKGQSSLIKAFSLLQPQIPGWKLILAGGTRVGSEPEDLNKLKKSAAKLPVEFIFNPDITQIQKLYSESPIFWSASGFGVNEKLNPTLVEHFGISLVESMAAGCVPIVTGLGGHKEIIESGSDGYFFDSLDQLNAKTLELISDQKLLRQLSQSAIAKSKMFGTDKFYEKALDLVGSGAHS